MVDLMQDIQAVRTASGHTIFVEVVDSRPLPEEVTAQRIDDLPENAEQTSSAATRVLDTLGELKNTLREISGVIENAFAESAPQAWHLELKIGFKGKGSLIPVILSGEGEAALKLKVEWKKS